MGITTEKIIRNIADRLGWIEVRQTRYYLYKIMTPNPYSVVFNETTGKFLCKDKVMEELINREADISFGILFEEYDD